MSKCMRTQVKLSVERCPDGYLKDPENWNEELAKQLASEWHGLEFNEKEHLPILYFIRQHHQKHQTTPDVREATHFLMKQKDLTKKEAKKHLFKLFPHGYMQQGCQLAGMRRPTAWCVG